MTLRVYFTGKCYELMANIKRTQNWFEAKVENGYYTQYGGVLDLVYEQYSDSRFFDLLNVLRRKCPHDGITYSIWELFGDKERPMYIPDKVHKPHIDIDKSNKL